MDRNWLIYMAVLFLAIFGSEAYSEHTKSECKTAALQAGKNADEIAKICK
jgi:hypothetical protein